MKTAREAVELTARQSCFVDEYLVDMNATQAAIRAGFAKSTADKKAPLWVGKSRDSCPEGMRHVWDAVNAALKERSARTRITADMVLDRWWSIATADPGSLTQLRRGCCRYCHGDDHLFQWKDEAEFSRAMDNADEGKEPSDEGGYGFRPFHTPHPSCPECGGEGLPRVYAEDTRNLGPEAKMLFAGVKQTKEGLEVKMQDQAKALENVARHLGMFTDRVDHVSSDGSMTPKPTIIELVAPHDDSEDPATT
ncbi:terminase small subunit [Salinicola lusitanus]|uniref:terminase small subunit n=1 Tax=Salinicola lusitanus TaxID=1949085 RepID=UPI000DA2117B|nr:terminase small subunit [Salinicola lusitanus]